MSIANSKYEHIVLHDNVTDRPQAYKANKRLLLLFWLIVIIIVVALIHHVITDPDHLAEYRDSILTYIIGMCVLLSTALFTSYFLIWIPSLFFAKAVNPEILLTDGHLIFLGGSVVLNYGSLIALHRPMIFLLGYDESLKINRDELISITIEEARFLKPGFGLGEQIVIKTKNGEIATGNGLNSSEKQAIVERLIKWSK